jgi:hypothetical protein
MPGNRIGIVPGQRYYQDTWQQKIRVETTQGEGSAFVVSLPIVSSQYENIFTTHFFFLHFREDPGAAIVRR